MVTGDHRSCAAALCAALQPHPHWARWLPPAALSSLAPLLPMPCVCTIQRDHRTSNLSILPLTVLLPAAGLCTWLPSRGTMR